MAIVLGNNDGQGNSVTIEQVMYLLFNHIRKAGRLEDVTHPRMGGIWSADTWVLNGVKAQLCDDGATQAIIADGYRAWCTLDQPVEFSNDNIGNEFLIGLFHQFFPDVEVVE